MIFARLQVSLLAHPNRVPWMPQLRCPTRSAMARFMNPPLKKGKPTHCDGLFFDKITEYILGRALGTRREHLPEYG